MSDKAGELAQRREALTVVIARERDELAVQVTEELAPPLQRIERIEEGARFVRAHALWFAIPLIGLALFFPRRTWLVLTIAFRTWQQLRHARELIALPPPAARGLTPSL